MKIYDLFSGFIAAVVIALGAGLYVNEDTSVGEELVVEEVREVVRADRWVMIELIDPNPLLQGDPDNQKIIGIYDANVEFPCDKISGTICAVKLSTDATLNDLEDLTVADALDQDLVEYTPSGPEYSHFQ